MDTTPNSHRASLVPIREAADQVNAALGLRLDTRSVRRACSRAGIQMRTISGRYYLPADVLDRLPEAVARPAARPA